MIDYDEALYVSCARQMVTSGDWITPRLNTRLPERAGETRIAFYEKPVFVYWASAGAMRLLGLHLWAARLPVALASLFTTLLVYLAGRNWFGRRAGLLSGLVYATAPMTLIDARQMTTDALLVLWLTIAMLCFWMTHQGRGKEGAASGNVGAASSAPTPSPRSSLLFPSLFWLMCGLAVLTKGVVGLLLPFLIIGVYLLLDRWFLRVSLFRTIRPRLRVGVQMRPLRVLWMGIARLRPISGLLLFGLVAAPWHALIALRPDLDAQGRTWVQEYLLRQHIGRFRGLDAVHNQPIFTFFIYFLLGFFPWACFAPAAFRAGRRSLHHRDTEAQRDSQRTEEQDKEEQDKEEHGREQDLTVKQAAERQGADSACITPPSSFLLTWFWTIFVFFSLGAAKLPTYITPAYPAAALLLGRWLDQALAGRAGENDGESGRQEGGQDRNKDEKTASEAATGNARVGRSLRRGALSACGVGVMLLLGALSAPDHTTTGVPIPADLIRFGMHVALLFALGGGAAWLCFRQAELRASHKSGPGPDERLASTAMWRERGIGMLALMMFLAIGIIATEGYAAVRNSVLGPYQQLASAANADARKGMPVLFYAITPRRPSMLFYAEYAPFEHKETPFLPYLAYCLTPAQREADVIMTGKAYETIVVPEIQKLPGASIRVLQKRGPADGWLLTRVFVPAGYVPPPLPHHKNSLWETVSY